MPLNLKLRDPYRRAKGDGRCVRCCQPCDRADRVCCAACRGATARVRNPGPCAHCGTASSVRKRNLCPTCYRRDDIRNAHQPEQVCKPLDPAREVCKHCRERNAQKYKRGLCSRCYWSPEIRDRYRVRAANKPKDDDGPTMEELEALIAERLPTMPQEPRYERGRTLPQVVARGRGVQARERRRDR